MDRVVIVTPSVYGTDNSATLDGIRQLGPKRARGVAVIGPSGSFIARGRQSVVRGGLFPMDTQEKVRIDQNPFERELYAAVKAAAIVPAGVEKLQQRL